MSVSHDICVRCKGALKTPYICEKCGKTFHQSCVKDYIKSKQETHCCKKKFGYLLKKSQSTDVDTQETAFRNSKSRLTSLRSASSQPEFFSPVSPTFVQSPTSDSVFTPSTPREINTVMTESPQKSTQESLPEGWPGMTTDEKLTTVMKSLVSLTIAVAEIPEIKAQSTSLSTKFDILTDSLNKLQVENVKTRDELAKLNDKLVTNANNTSQIETKLVTLTEQLNTKTQTLSDEILLLKSVAMINPDVSDLLPSSHPTSELVISGIPESVSLHLSPEDITTEIFNKLFISDLKSDILCVREIKKKTKPNDDTNNQRSKNDRPLLHSYMLKLKSSQIRDFIIEKKENRKCFL
ncbi:hypothetical protein KQX54_009422 [Cotesia glomerata]|uniref:Phorbol-ester/DAG-type domain-containing protein n=1 Tax=Cotesia glomerata TaxID=32391 RepID=A0AAV7I2I0_COTGL|nr:hypothetical protein KQX54_009422 [Cotesia glomerata]